MIILYYAWKEYTYEDATGVLRSMGHEPVIDNTPYSSFDNDDKLISTITSKIRQRAVG